jgi:hypothetical protein
MGDIVPSFDLVRYCGTPPARTCFSIAFIIRLPDGRASASMVKTEGLNGRHRPRLFEFAAGLKHETDKAFLLNDGTEDRRLPKPVHREQP